MFTIGTIIAGISNSVIAGIIGTVPPIVLIFTGFLPNEIVKDSRNFWTKSEFNGVLKAFTLAFFLKATILEFSNLSVSAGALSKIKKPCSVI
jgi:chromate transport protein ChrA